MPKTVLDIQRLAELLMMHLFLTTIIILRLFKRPTRFSYYRREKVFVTVNHTQKVSSLKEVLDLKDKNPGQT